MPERPEKPNILFIFTDQQRADTMACYGNSMISTPNLNALADGSFVFENGYVSAPICTPSRSTIMTGLWPHVSGCLKNNVRLEDSVQTIADMLPDDYHTAYYGKWHLGNEVIKQHGFDEWLSIEDQYRDYYTDPKYYEVLSDYHHYLIEKGYAPDKESQGAMVFSREYAAALPEEHTKATFLGHKAAEFIQNNKDRPFALYVNIFEPHPPYDGPFNSMYDPQAIPTSPVFMKDPPENACLQHKLRAQESAVGGGFEPSPKVTPPQESFWRDIIARYWGMVTMVDNAVGKILQALEEAGIADNTIVVYSAEHGDQMGDHNIIQKAVFYEQSVKVPMLLRVPWLSDGTRVPGRYGHIDTVPTLLDLCGVELPEHLQGESKVPVLQGDATLENNDVMIDWTGRNLEEAKTYISTGDTELGNVQDTPHRILISHDGWKLTLSELEQGELYNLNDDPYEDKNLFNHPAQRRRIPEMAYRIRDWQYRNDDNARLRDV